MRFSPDDANGVEAEALSGGRSGINVV